MPFDRHTFVLACCCIAYCINCCVAFQGHGHFPWLTNKQSTRSFLTRQKQRQRQQQQKAAEGPLFYKFNDRSPSNHTDSSGDDLNNHPFNRRRQQEEYEAMAFQRRMEQVRSLQLSYYTTSTSFMDNPKQPACQLQERTGRLLQLPLWRDAEWQVPGRSNVLEITDPVYTNMFESILYKPQPWCFGHLFLERQSQPEEYGRKKNQEKSEQKYATSVSSSAQQQQQQQQQQPPLFTWKDAPTSLSSLGTTTSSSSSSPSVAAVLGCLMHIADYRRMSDGRLLLLVHAMERFVVTDIVRKLPYAVVNAQVLPDTEEIDPLLLDELSPDMKETDLQDARAMAVQESVKFHAYEYDPHHSFAATSPLTQTQNPSRLAGDMDSSNFALPPLPPQQQIHVEEHISPADIAKVLPFCPFAKIPLDDARSTTTSIAAVTVEDVGSDVSATENYSHATQHDGNEPPLEYRLLHRGLLKVPPSDPDFVGTSSQAMTIDELEHELWLAMNHFLVTTKLPVSPVLLSLLPPRKKDPRDNDADNDEWPQSFFLYKIADDLANLESIDHDFVVVSPDYPSYRRQRRLSFSAAYLLEDYYATKLGQHKAAQSLKKLLLSIPSTKQRLRVILEKFLQWQQQKWGEFQ